MQDGETRGGAALLPQQISGSGLASWERLGGEDPNTRETLGCSPPIRALDATLQLSLRVILL